jgi:hypothetical protein
MSITRKAPKIARGEAREDTGERGDTGRDKTRGDATDDEIAIATLRGICRDSQAPAGARAQAARTLLEVAGALGKDTGNGDTGEGSEMTGEALDKLIQELKSKG